MMAGAAQAPRPATAPAPQEVMARAGGENFPVASFFLPASARRHLLAIYGFARLVDELGDSMEGDRLAALSWLEDELDAAFSGRAMHPIMRRLQASIAECDLQAGPLKALIEANRVDQSVHRYETWEQLQGYCELSANPVGELVLAVFGLASPDRIALSDRICTALQLIEHCQDVAEDLSAGRIYMPRRDMELCGCTEQDLAAPHANAATKALIALEMRRADSLLREGAPLLGTLRGRPRIAVAAFLAGGCAAVQAIYSAGCDVLPGAPKAGTARRLLAIARVLAWRMDGGPRRLAGVPPRRLQRRTSLGCSAAGSRGGGST